MLAKAPAKVKPSKVEQLKLFTHRVYDKHDQLRVVYYRYGSINDFSVIRMKAEDISKILSINVSTVMSILNRFIRNGYNVVMKRQFNKGARHLAKIQG